MGDMPTFKVMILLLLVLDPFGNIPTFLAILKDVEPRRRRQIIVRELFFALVILLFFLFFGQNLLNVLGVKQPSLQLAGGLMLFLISINMLFPGSGMDASEGPERNDPFIVPLAMPLVAGPSAMTLLILMGTDSPSRIWNWLQALVGAWAITSVIILSSSSLSHLLGAKGLQAMARLMGMILTVIAVQILVNGMLQAFPGLAGGQP